MDYGGEAPTVEELDQDCKAMVVKYARWLKESGENFKVDETKRVKKQTWWGLLTGSNNNEPPMTKEEFLKTIQID